MSTPAPSHTFCNDFSDTSSCNTIISVRQVAAGLSLVGCVFILGSIYIYQRYQSVGQRLILFLTLSALINTIFYFLGDTTPQPSSQCTAQGWFITYFDWVVLLWDACLTHFLYLAIHGSSPSVLWKKQRTYHLLCWGLPLVPASIPLFWKAYGPAGAWCWVVGTHVGLRFAVWYIPMILVLLFIGTAYVLIYKKLEKSGHAWNGFGDDGENTAMRVLKGDVATLRWYPVVYVVLSLFALVNRIQNAASPHHPILGLYILHALSTPLQGLFNSIVYMRNNNFKNFLQTLRRRFTKTEVREYNIMEEQSESEDSDADTI
eukprot:m.39534 g.39534  ORF g.39534 m.39534 type:complete len:317 (+) comp6870_c0_seq4:120-1070(+)